jgi:hypothetical protein
MSTVSFDMFMVEDAEKVLKNYKFALFTAVEPTKNGKDAIEFCKKAGIPFISSTKEKPFYNINELRDIITSNGVHCYNDEGNVFYYGNGFLGIHTVDDGEVKIKLPKKHIIRPLLEKDERQFESDTITFSAPKHTTKLFELL